MNKLLVKIFLQPLLVLVIFIILGLALIFLGDQTISVKAIRQSDGDVIFDCARSHFWGAMKFSMHVENVMRAEVVQSTSRIRSHHHSKRIKVSNIVLVNNQGSNPLLNGSSSINNDQKKALAGKINSFLQNNSVVEFEEIFRFTNILYWIGLGFLLIGLWGLANLPGSVSKAIKKPGG